MLGRARPKQAPDRRNREPMSSSASLLLLSFSSLSPRARTATEGRREGGFFSSPSDDRSIPRGQIPPSLSSRHPLYSRTHPKGSPLVQISILRRQLFATLLFFHSVTHMEMEIGHRNPVCQFGKHPRQGRERGRVNRVSLPSPP